MILGIDLGTTYSVGAYIDESGQAQVISNAEGQRLTPSVVLLEDNPPAIVGDRAKELSIVKSDRIVKTVKRRMGEQVTLKEIGGRRYTPEIISSFILRKVAQDAESATGMKVDSVVITVPAYFSDAKRKATADAASLAGLKLAGIINEPTAAALCYVRQNHISDKKILIYDLGGGTFDVTVLQAKSENDITVLATDGLREAGGYLFDQAIVDYVRKQMEEKHNIDLEDDAYSDELQELYNKAEQAKIQLSSRQDALIAMHVGNAKETYTITREQFHKMIEMTYEKTRVKIDHTIKEAGMTKEQIDVILLVGGSSQIPYIRERLMSYFGKEPARNVNPHEAVAIGAALYPHMSFTDVCSHSIGIAVFGKDRRTRENEPIIPRNAQIPVEMEKRFRTPVNDMTMLELTVTEGEYTELTDVTIIGSFEIAFPKPVPKAGSPVVVRFRLDSYQLLHIHLSIPDISFESEYYLPRSSNLSGEELEAVRGLFRDYTVE